MHTRDVTLGSLYPARADRIARLGRIKRAVWILQTMVRPPKALPHL